MKKFNIIIVAMLLLLLPSSSIFGALPSKVFAPYVYVGQSFSLMDCYNSTGQKYFTLAFIIANGTQPEWDGSIPMSQNYMLDQITALRAVGGDVIVSFGGASGTPIDAAITSVSSLVSAYQSIIDRYGLTWIDFDIEGSWVTDQTSISRRNQAARQLQINNPSLRITYCLPVMPTGLESSGINVINNAISAGVNIYAVNIMAMDYGQGNSTMGTAAISAAQNTRTQTSLNIGITPMIGQNDSQGEIFSLTNASEVLSFANSNSYVNLIAFWSAGRDNGGCPGQSTASATCSGLSQSSFAFINTLKSFSSGDSTTVNITPPTVSITSPDSGATFPTFPASITINATASADTGKTISQVAFYQGNTLLGIDTTSPYSFLWNNVPQGIYQLTAKATDNKGFFGTSSPVKIVVGNPLINLALGKKATASSVEATTTFIAANAVDGDLKTRWSSQYTDPQWLAVDLGQSYSFNTVVIRWEAAYGKAYKIQVSNDDSTWITIDSTTTGKGGVDSLTGLSGNGRYIRMYCTARTTVNGKLWGYSLYEFEVWNVGTTDVRNPTNDVPKNFAIFQNYPNPFNPSTTLHYTLLRAAKVQMTVYDVRGVKIRELVNRVQSSGAYDVSFDASSLPSGTYFAHFVAVTLDGSKQINETKKMILIK
jgi:chitinase